MAFNLTDVRKRGFDLISNAIGKGKRGEKKWIKSRLSSQYV